MKITGTSKVLQQFVDRVEAGAAVGKLDVGQDQARALGLGQRDRFGVRARNAEHAMAETFDQPFEIHAR